MVYVPDVLVDGVTVPVAGSIVRPAGEALYAPPAVPVLVTTTAPDVLQNCVPG